MFDLAQTTNVPTWQDALAVGDIVLFRFPMTAAEEAAGRPPMRPCLVLEVERRGAAPRMVLVPGTSRQTRAVSAYEIAVRDADEIVKAGLRGPYRFRAQMPLSVSLDNPQLRTGGGEASPVIGRLTDLSRERMQGVRARLHAEHDIAAERRLEAQKAKVEVTVRPSAWQFLEAYRAR